MGFVTVRKMRREFWTSRGEVAGAAKAQEPGGRSLPLELPLRQAFAEAVLSAEIGAEGVRDARRDFVRWLDAFEPVADHDHRGGGCRMDDHPPDSVADSEGRAHADESRWIAGAPPLVSSGCSDGALTFATLCLRTASALLAEA